MNLATKILNEIESLNLRIQNLNDDLSFVKNELKSIKTPHDQLEIDLQQEYKKKRNKKVSYLKIYNENPNLLEDFINYRMKGCTYSDFQKIYSDVFHNVNNVYNFVAWATQKNLIVKIHAGKYKLTNNDSML